MATSQPRKSKLDPFLAQVGVVPDADVAALAGVSAESVRTYRKRRGIPAGWRGEEAPLTAEQAATDDLVAVPLDAEPRKAAKKRKASKPKAKKAAARTPRAEEPKVEPVVEAEPAVEEAPIVEPAVDAEPAVEEAPIIEPAVDAEPAVEEAPIIEPAVDAEPTPEPVIEAEPAEDLPPEPESAPAPAPRISSTRKPRKTKLDPYLDKVGLIPDKQVAELAGVTVENVRAYRVRRGIPARWRGEGEGEAAVVEPTPVAEANVKPAEGAVARVGGARRGKLTPYMGQIGIVPDARIAELSGTTSANVRAFRLRHDIPARWRGEGEPLPNEEAILTLEAGPSAAEVEAGGVVEPTAPAAQAVELPSESDGAAVPVARGPAALLEAYVVTIEGPQGAVEYAVVGEDIVEATTSAVAGMARAGIAGKLVATRFLARVLGG
ncbi:MAG: hypothetical protein ABIO70_26335 [Pseudomonadota bacterium]